MNKTHESEREISASFGRPVQINLEGISRKSCISCGLKGIKKDRTSTLPGMYYCESCGQPYETV